MDFDSIRLISGMLKEGGIIVYPTDTFYGLGGNCHSLPAVKRIYTLKKRDSSKPLSVLAAGMKMVEANTVKRPAVFSKLAQKFWPGPLTMILKASSRLPNDILGPGRTLAVRWPDCPWVADLLHHTGFPITATSANISGQAEISCPEEAARVFEGKVDGIVDGGPTPGGKPSTIVDLTQDKPRILREGAVPSLSLQPYLNVIKP